MTIAHRQQLAPDILTLRTRIGPLSLFYWRDKSGREIVVKKQNRQIDALECKVNPDHFDPKSLTAFRLLYPKGKNYIISPRIKVPYQQRHKGLMIHYCSLRHIDIM